MSHSNRSIRIFFTLCFLILTLKSPQSVSAQIVARNLRPPISRAQFDRVCIELNAEDSQLQNVLSTILFDYLEENKKLADEVQIKFNEAYKEYESYYKDHPGKGGSWSHTQDFGINAISQRWIIDSQHLETKFIENVETVLTQDQFVIWNSFLRQIRRNALLGEMQRVVEERSLYDLVAILADLELPESRLIDILSLRFEYELKLDEVLRLWREEYAAKSSEAMFFGSIMATLDVQSPRYKSLAERGKRIYRRYDELAEMAGTVNEQAKDNIASALGTPYDDFFLDRVNEIKYPKLFAPSPVEELMFAVQNDDRFTSEQLESTKDIVTQHRLVVRGLRAKYIPLLDKWDSSAMWKHLEREAQKQLKKTGVYTDPRSFHPSIEYVKQRIKIEREACRKLQRVLTENSQIPVSPAIHILLTWYSDAMDN